MIDYLVNRQAAGLVSDRVELNGKLQAVVDYFGIDWLSEAGDNPLQILWKNRDALATNELLNFGDAIENFAKVDSGWARLQADQIKNGDEGNRAGAIFELLGLNVFLHAGNILRPSQSANPGYDGVVELPDNSSMLVSIKNHGMTSYEKFFHKNAKELDDQFQEWLRKHSQSGVELRIIGAKHLDAGKWLELKRDVKSILDGQIDGTAKNYRVKGDWNIVLKLISPEFNPLSTRNISSVVFILAKAHKNEQNKFIEDIRKGCSNLVKY